MLARRNERAALEVPVGGGAVGLSDGGSRVARYGLALLVGAAFGGAVSLFKGRAQRTGPTGEEREAREGEERFRILAGEALEGIAISFGGRVLEANPALLGMFGYGAEELRGRDALSLIHPEDREGVSRRIAAGEAARCEVRALRKDGSVFPVELRSREIPYRGGVARLTSVLDLTDRRRAEASLRQSEELYRTVVEQAAENIFVIDVETRRIVQANAAFRRTLGYGEGEIEGLRLHDFVVLDRRDLDESVRRIVDGERLTAERTYRRKDGTLLDVEVSASAISLGGRDALCVVAHDVTERNRTEERLRRSEAGLLEAQRVANLGDWEYAIDEDRARWSDQTFRIFGFEPQGFAPTYRMFFDRVHPEDRPSVRGTVFRALRGEAGSDAPGSDVDYRILRPDGEVRVVNTHYGVERDGSGRAVRLFGTMQDITERREAERRLLEAETRFRTLVEQIPAVTYVEAVDRGGRTTALAYASPRIEAMFGYSPEEWMADPDLFPKLLHPEDRDRVLAEDERTDRTGEPFKAEYRQYTRDGRVIWVRDEAVLIRDARGAPLYWQGVMFDVTEQKRHEEELERRAEELRRSNAELEQFAYVASHDLQEPLRMVSSYTQLLQRRYGGRLDEDADEFIGYAVDGAERMRRLIDDLLAYSRVGTRGRPLAPTSAQTALDAALANLRVAIEESGARIEAGPLPTVLGDETQLVQLFQNLVGNALKFRGDRPPVVTLGAEPLPGSGGWLFSVKDNGIGIEPGGAERIFVIFQRLHDRAEYGGTGIGLAVCKKIVERHGGRIWAESEGVPGGGSAFRFTLKGAENG
jgi:PAS domain S-box-containing protein